ncbi:MAG: DUF1330 domain-containing protein [Burkholderiales bacterium]
MSAFIIVNIDVTDPEGFAKYRELVAPTIHAAGGRYRIRGGTAQVLEGSFQPKRMVMLEFDNREAALAWYESGTYAPLKALRQQSSSADVILVDGVD